jgi:hypothetical protein
MSNILNKEASSQKRILVVKEKRNLGSHARRMKRYADVAATLCRKEKI